jgi:hypothetical protein
MMEVPLVCPRCERRSVGHVARESRLRIRHSGHYELTCRECQDGKPTLASVISALSGRWQSQFPNLTRMNDGQGDSERA